LHDIFERLPLGSGDDAVYLGQLPGGIAPDFEILWNQHPDQYAPITMYGKVLNMPRWQQSYLRDYEFSGQIARAKPLPGDLQPMLEWVRAEICPDLNGVLVNWYDGSLGHYIGAHRDNEPDLRDGAPIVTISLGEERIFRMRPYSSPKQPVIDRIVKDGDVLIIPSSVNETWTHEVPKRSRYRGKRISVTFRAFRSPDS
jgi:alkylated DNA repair dioxygenase AlkB